MSRPAPTRRSHRRARRPRPCHARRARSRDRARARRPAPRSPRVSSGPSPANGSSSSRMRGCIAKAIASSRRRFSPCASVPAARRSDQPNRPAQAPFARARSIFLRARPQRKNENSIRTSPAWPTLRSPIPCSPAGSWRSGTCEPAQRANVWQDHGSSHRRRPKARARYPVAARPIARSSTTSCPRHSAQSAQRGGRDEAKS